MQLYPEDELSLKTNTNNLKHIFWIDSSQRKPFKENTYIEVFDYILRNTHMIYQGAVCVYTHTNTNIVYQGAVNTHTSIIY